MAEQFHQDPGSRNPTPMARRHDAPPSESRHDAYRETEHHREPAVCDGCGAVYRSGRWTWPTQAPPAGAHHVDCPACRRTRDDYPAGFLELRGAVVAGHRQEVLDIVHRETAQERQEHPLHRIIAIRPAGGDGAAIEVTTTDVHLPRRLGRALQQAHGGTFDFHYADEDQVIRARWDS